MTPAEAEAFLAGTVDAVIGRRHTAHAFQLWRYSNGVEQELQRQLNRLRTDLIAELAERPPISPDAPLGTRTRQLTALLEATSATIATSYGEMQEHWQGEMTELAGVESEFARVTINDAVGVDLANVSLTPTQIKTIATDVMVENAPASEWWRRMENNTRSRFSDAVRQGILRGDGMDAIARRVRGEGRATEQNPIPDDSILSRPAHELRAWTRTGVQAVSNTAQLDLYRANGDIITGVKALTTLDTRTSKICIARTGAAWDLDGAPLPQSLRKERFPGPPPWHWQCRSTLLPVMKGFGDLNAKQKAALKKIPAGTRESMFGPLPASTAATDFGDFLNMLPEAEQRKMLGVGTWEMWKAGRVQLHQLLDDRGNILTVAELKKLALSGEYVPAPPRPVPPDEPGGSMTAEKLGKLYAEHMTALGANLDDWGWDKQQLETFAAKASTPGDEMFDAGFHAKVQAAAAPPPAAPPPKKKKAEYVPEPAKAAPNRKIKISREDILPALDPDTTNPTLTDPSWALAEGETWQQRSYGGVIFDDFGRVLLREPRDHFGGYWWTWPKGRVDDGDASPLATALREVAEETGHVVEAVAHLKGTYTAGLGRTNCFIMRSKGVNPNLLDGETASARWVTLEEAKTFIAQTRNSAGAQRDLAILDAARKKYDRLMEAVAAGKKPPTPGGGPAGSGTLPPPPGEFPADLSDLRLLSRLGGSTGAERVADPATGKSFVRKTGNSPEHLRSEFAAEAAYAAAGVPVPASRLYEGPQGPVKLGKFIEGRVMSKLRGAEWEKAAAALREHFVADALFGNYDVVGMDFDNVMLGDDGVVYRIDVGGSLRFRAQGALKEHWGRVVDELRTLRDPRVNSAAAKVFGSLTDAEINRQIGVLLERRDDIIRALPEVEARLVAQRLDWLEQRIRPRGAGAAGPWSAAKWLDGVDKAGIRGRSYFGDEGAVEDMQVLVWQEVDQTGQTVTRMQMRLTAEGSATALAMLNANGHTLARTPNYGQLAAATHPGGAQPLPGDVYHADILAAVKNVAYHLSKGDKEWNAQKVAAALKHKDLLNALAAGGGPETEMLGMARPDEHTQAMAAGYVQAIKNIEDVIAGKKKTVAQFKQYLYVPPPAPAPGDAMRAATGKLSREVFPLNKKEVGPGSVPRELSEPIIGSDRRPVSRRAPGFRLDLDDGTTVNFVPWEQESADYAFRGRLLVTVPGEASPAAMQRFAETMQEQLGIDVTPTPDAYREMVYLLKTLELNGHGRTPRLNATQTAEWRRIVNSPAPVADRVADLRRFAERALGVRLPTTPDQNYDPAGATEASGNGWHHIYRWDLPPDAVEREMAGYVLRHQTSLTTAQLVAKIIANGGQISPTSERARTGQLVIVADGTPESMSPERDMETGGAEYFFTRIRKAGGRARGQTIEFKVRNLARVDAFTFNHDRFGEVRSDAAHRERYTTPADWKRIAGAGSNDETNFKRGLGIDDIQTIWTSGAAEREQVVAMLTSYLGGPRMPDGRLIKNVVK